MNTKEIKKGFLYNGFFFTPYYRAKSLMDEGSFGKQFHDVHGTSTRRDIHEKYVEFANKFNYDEFYAVAKENGCDDYDVFECRGTFWCPCGTNMVEFIFNGEQKPEACVRRKTIKIDNPETSSIACFDDAEEFYPTPEVLANEMLDMVNPDIITGYNRDVLEPSAGKGDLADMLVKRGGYQKNIDCIEKNVNLQNLLKGKGYRVVGDDFLNFNTEKTYDAIVLNPPFSNGDEHLLKAIEMQKNGGQVVCMLNAETILNPYAQRRKELIKLLDEYRASITFYDGGFSDAEKPTDVSVAIVNINIPAKYDKSEIFENMQKAENEKEEEFETQTALIPSDFVSGLIHQFNVEVKAGKELLRQYEALKPNILYTVNSEIENHYHAKDEGMLRLMVGDNVATVNSYLRAVRYKYWNYFFANEELTKKLTYDMQRKYRDLVNSLDEYDFNVYNISQILDQMQNDLYVGLEDAIIKIFDKLSVKHSYNETVENGNVHYYNGWKTNKAYKIADKVVIPTYGIFSDWSWCKDTFKVYEAYEQLSDIEKAFNYLDGCTTKEVDMTDRLSEANVLGNTKNIPLKYFSVTFYKKGTCHIKFNPEAIPLLDKFNIYVSRKKAWLPPTYGVKHYDDMDEEEKACVDDFQGREAYERVLANSKYFLVSDNSRLALT